MGNYMKVLFDGVKVFILFTGCTIMFYYAMTWINQEYEYYHRYDEPGQGAVKASTTTALAEADTAWWERLFLFYLNGE